MSSWSSIPRRLLLRLAGSALAVAPVGALAQASTGAPGTAPPKSAAASEGGGPPPGRLPLSAIWSQYFAVQRIWAYADRHSVTPGEKLNVMAAGGPGQPTRKVRLEVFRVGAADPQKVWVSDFVDVPYRGATMSGASIGPGWPPTFADIDTTGWPPGCYYGDVVEMTTAVRDVKACFWVVRNPKRSGRILLRLGTNTYQAYNDWGGHSIYPNDDDENRGLIISFDRPCTPSFWEYDVFMVQWLEGLAQSLGGVDYATNFDVHSDPTILDPYALVITGSHDEYWSKEEFDAFWRRIFQQGRNVAFFGANTAYCQVRYGDLDRAPGTPDRGRQLVCYKTASDPITRRGGSTDPRLLETSNFRTDARRPESMLLGGAFQNWFEPATPQRPTFHVARTDLPFFEGTGWKVGDPAADVIGYEWDNRDPDGDGKRLWAEGKSLIPAIDANRIIVLFQGRAEAADGTTGLAEATYFRSPAGAQVFNAAAIRWAWGLGKETYVNAPFQRFNENLVRALSGAPARS
ncbi:MAG: hypothetical protein JO111_06195 [Caulobacteraceae bacterium]|nr:hypothetical protein [Caulobacteraceae bacterium]